MKRIVTFLVTALFAAASVEAKPLKVFILAGQSNMEGPANINTFDYIGSGVSVDDDFACAGAFDGEGGGDVEIGAAKDDGAVGGGLKHDDVGRRGEVCVGDGFAKAGRR